MKSFRDHLKDVFASDFVVEAKPTGNGKLAAAVAAIAVAAFLSVAPSGASAADTSAAAYKRMAISESNRHIDDAGLSVNARLFDAGSFVHSEAAVFLRRTVPNGEMTFLKAISDNRVSVALASGPTGSWRYACAAFVGDFSSGREFLRLTSAKIEFDVPSFPLDVAYRFVSNHEAAHCLSGVSREHVRSARTLNHRDRDSVAELVFHTRHEESIADAFAILAEIRRGTDRETLSKIADARYAALSSRAHDATRGFTHDTGPAISSILADYDRLSKDPFFLRATTADLMKRATAYAENNRLSRDEIAAAIENSAKIRRVVENGGFSAGDADPRGTIANVVAAHARLEESARRERSQAAQIAETAASAGNSASLETRNDIDAWFAGAEKTTATLPSP